MEDAELQALRQQRLNQLQTENAGADKNAQKQEQLQQQEMMKNSILSQVLDQEARARLNTLKLSKPEKAQGVEAMIIRMAQMGQLGGKLDDTQFVSLLNQVNAQMPSQKSTVKYDRRRAAIDSDDEDYGC
ncbi:programmed cell death protein 5 [Condylostylus longicornis]|uniref:programmed cell death protein 5 n=1 Tax=Condylostylus longicornis TaxID=2530218 RepID=UPI00244E1204|nr:programmed cell death protein 5 [Condylostylus longicornis]XP_055383770.1 programmed cell death protein 5 [Condylostylus longicornis]